MGHFLSGASSSASLAIVLRVRAAERPRTLDGLLVGLPVENLFVAGLAGPLLVTGVALFLLRFATALATLPPPRRGPRARRGPRRPAFA
jgi:hypothetical protein